MTSILVFLIVLGIMILVHELGHFAACKLTNVKVLVFSLGMGPKLIARQWGETRYQIAAIPMGGYVKMLGEVPEDSDEEIPPEDIPRSYWEQSPLKRMFITAAGPFLNLVMAFAIAPISYIIGIEVPSYSQEPPVVVGVAPESPAYKAGFQQGDRILTIDGKNFETWEQVEEYLYTSPDSTVNIEYIRDGEKHEASMTLQADSKYGLGISGFDPSETTVIGMFTEDSAANAAGLEIKDKITEIDGKTVDSFSALRQAIQQAAPGPFSIKAVRTLDDGSTKNVEVSVKPKEVEQEGKKHYLIGVGPYLPKKTVKYGLAQAFVAGSAFLWDKAVGNIKALGKLVTGQLGFKTMSGPVGIGFVVSSAQKQGFSYLVQITALISLLLGIINFFPIPALDGGHIMFATLELMSRRKLNRRVVDIMNTAGFFLLLTLIFAVSVQDVWRFRSEILRFFFRIG